MKELWQINDCGEGPYIYWAENRDTALTLYNRYRFSDTPVATKVLTDQGYPIVRLKDVPDGTPFHFVNKVAGLYLEYSATWEKIPGQTTDKGCKCRCFAHKNRAEWFRNGDLVSIDTAF